MNVTILLCGGPMSGKTMLARVLVEMLREHGFGVAYSEVSVPAVGVGGVPQEVGEVLVVTDTTPPKPVRPVHRKTTDTTPASAAYVQPPDNTADFIAGYVLGQVSSGPYVEPGPPAVYEPTSPSTDYSSGSGDFGGGLSGDAGGW